MSTEHSCQITTRDLDILTTILDRRTDLSDPFVNLLRNKLECARICFREDIAPDVATLNSRIVYQVEGRKTGPHLLVQCQYPDLPDFALSIHTLCGLTLLGLAEGERATLAYATGEQVTILLEEVTYQPEAHQRSRAAVIKHPGGFRSWTAPKIDAEQSNIVQFPSGSRIFAGHEPEDDGPGPHAA